MDRDAKQAGNGGLDASYRSFRTRWLRTGLNMLEDSFEPYYVAGVRLSWNLGKLYTLKNDRRKIEVSRRQIDVQRETFLFNTRLQLLQQNTEIKKMTDLMRADDDIIRLRTSIKQAAEVKLENGVISVTDLTPRTWPGKPPRRTVYSA